MKNNKVNLKVGIVGCGLIGIKRAEAILSLGTDKVAGLYDINKQRMQNLARKTGAQIYPSWQKLVSDPEIDCVIVAVYHKILPKIALAALKNGKYVLAEKPLGNNASEAKQIAKASKEAGRILKVGFNHRFHPAILKARQLFKNGKIGKLLYIRAVYGHGGRKDYDLEWRIQKKFSRGGEMYDQGSHLIDLGYWFAGEFKCAFASTKNYFWEKTSLEDNAFCQLEAKTGQTLHFQVSLTQWKNRFTFEVYGTGGYLLISGLGRSYGVETLTYGKRVGLGQVPREQVWQFLKGDDSWNLEWLEFKQAIAQKRQPLSSALDNVEVMKAVDCLYKSAKSKKMERIG
jgi:predicted dehydrogenase